MKVALIHDHLAQDGGAEKVLKSLSEIYPDAPIYTLLYNKKNVAKYYPGRKIEASIIQKMPGGIKHYRWYMPFMPMAIEFFDLRGYDVVISDTASFAKGVITSPDTLHICYCHTPTRYLWSDTHQYINELRYNKFFKKIISMVLNYVRMWDRLAADRVDVFIANSKVVQKRIKKYYSRESDVIYPPTEIKKFHVADLETGNKKSGYFLCGCRLVPYKRIDIVIEAFKKLNSSNPNLQPDALKAERQSESETGQYKLKIFGDGIDLPRLKEIAGGAPNIEFLGRVSDEERASLYAECQAFINPQAEDFGITIMEAFASGRPAIALKSGGACETIIEGKCGEFFNEETPEAIMKAVKNFRPEKYDPKEIRAHAEKFSEEKFKKEIKEFVDKEYKKFISNY
ncbi:MAG: glycosyltransferase [Patescibacteria group bacterium]|jgi:glycosyltransferase involved in cell wall biosynthesis